MEKIKDMLAHGATQEAINNEDLRAIKLLIPDKQILKSFENYTKAITLRPEYTYCYYFRVGLYEKLGEYNKAIADYTKLIELETGTAGYYEQRANIYCKLHNYENAIKDFTSAIETHESYLNEMTKKSEGEILLSTGGVSSENMTVLVLKDIRRCNYERGIAYYELQRFDDAVHDFKLITENDKQYLEAKEYLNKVLIKRNNRYLENRGN